MAAVQAQRTLVKSVPEVWSALSEAAVLAPLLDGAFGEIRITALETESRIEWESELAAGAVELEPSGFGTRVRLSADLVEIEPERPPPRRRRRGLLARLLRRPGPPPSEPAAAPSGGLEAAAAEGALSAVLDEIGAARHRPFSRGPGSSPPIA